MRSESQKSKIFNRRAFTLAGIKIAVGGVLATRLGYLQLYRSNEFKTLSEENRLKLQLIAPSRGRILDRNEVAIAINEINYILMADPVNRESVAKSIVRLKEILELDDSSYNSILAEIRKNKSLNPVPVVSHLDWEQVSKISLYRHELAGLEIDVGQLRYYPLGEITSHLTGYVGLVSEKDEINNPLMRLPDFKIGKNGVEKVHESSLRGQAGVRRLEVNAHGLIIREVEREDSEAGEDLRLSIDMRLQQYAAEVMGENTGAVVVMDVRTGEIITYLSLPGYDSNLMSKAVSGKYWNELLKDKRNPLINKCVAGQYPPGSTFKMMTALAALEAGVVNASTSFFCPGHVDLGSHRFHCWKKGGHGTVDVIRALSESCDTYFYHVGQKVGIDKIADISRKFGLGKMTGIDIPNEKAGLMPDQAWKRKRYKMPWLPGETLNCSIGQGYVLTTPVQLSVMTAMLANGGRFVRPNLAAGENPNIKDIEPLNINPKNLDLVLRGMYASTNIAGGTAFGKRIMNPEHAMAGKTGTAQVKRIVRSGTKVHKETRREFKHHAWYVGYAPYHDPKYAITVLVEHGESGSGAAAPVARDILKKAQELEIL